MTSKAPSFQNAASAVESHLHLEVDKLLQEVLAELTALRQTLRARYVGRAINQNRHVVAAAELEAWFDKPLAELQAHRDAHERAYRADDRTAFVRGAYQRVVWGIGTLWGLYLKEAGDGGGGIPGLLSAEVWELEAAYNRDVVADPDRRAAFDTLYDTRRRALFESVCRRYREMMARLTQLRETWARRSWAWQDYAFGQIRAEGDAHDWGREALRAHVQHAFGTEGAIKYYMGFPGSTDRVIVPYSTYPWCKAMPFPDIQVAGAPGLLKANRFAQPPVEDLQAGPPSVRVAWVPPSDTPPATYRVEGRDNEVVPFRYAPERKLRLMVAANGHRAADLAAPDLSLTVRNVQAETPRAVVLPASLLRFAFNPRGVGTLEVEARGLLGQLGAGVNANLLEAEARVRIGGKPVAAKTADLAHVLRQRLIVFLPGVLGSEITVRRGGQNRTAFPRMSKNLVGEQPFSWLSCGRDGEPLPGNEAVAVDLFRRYELVSGVGQTVYDVENQPALTRPPGHPRLLVNGRPSPHYPMQVWPYDWRLRLEQAVGRLMGYGPGDPQKRIAPPYRVPPSLAECVAHHRRAHPLLEERTVVVGHSTGGVILRNLLTRVGVERLVETAAFVNTPFWGAPKAYYVFLCGDMGVPIVSEEFMVRLSPNCPIVYYLSPTERYPGEVAQLPDGVRVRRRPGQVVGDFLRPLMAAARKQGRYPRDIADPWNPALESAARVFHGQAAAEPRIGWGNCLVFWSDSGKNDTPGSVSLTSKGVARFAPVAGDSTVPSVSQRAEFAQHPGCLVELSSHPEHVPSPNQNQVWETLRNRLQRP